MARRFAHFFISFRRVHSLAVTPIIFEIIDAPRCVSFCILRFVILPARPAGAGQRAGAIVDAEFKTVRVEIIAQRFHAAGKTRFIADEIAVGIALFF